MEEAARLAGRDKATIYRWIAGYEEDGYAAFRRAGRADRGRRAVFVTRAWDAAVPFDDATRERIAGEVRHYVRRAWRSTTEPGWRWIARIASIELEELTVQAGFEGDARQLRQSASCRTISSCRSAAIAPSQSTSRTRSAGMTNTGRASTAPAPGAGPWRS